MRTFYVCLAGLAGACLALLLACCISAAAHYVPRAPILDHIEHSASIMKDFRRSDTFTECLVMGGAAIGKESLLSDVFDFKMLNTDLPKDDSIPHDNLPCASLRALAAGQDQAPIGVTSYTHYWNGPVSLARFMLAVVPFLPAYILYAIVCFAAFAAWGYALSTRGVGAAKSGWIAFACMYGGGFPYFAGNLAHTPAFAVPLLLVAFATRKFVWWNDNRTCIFLAALVGGVTFYLDMLFLAIPFNALVLGATLLLVSPKASWKLLMAVLLAYAGGGALVLGTKVVAVALMADPLVVFGEFTQQLFWRMSGEDAHGSAFSRWDLVYQLSVSASKMFFHPLVLGGLYVACVIWFVKAFRQQPQRVAAFLLLALIVPTWCFVFANHSWIHGFFTRRILFWPPLLGFLAYLDMRHSSTGSKALSPSNPPSFDGMKAQS